MSDYEMADMFNDYMTLIFTVFMGHTSMVFAFLVASYLAAQKLKPSMVWIVVFLFTIGSLVTTVAQNRFGGAFIAMGGEMRKAVVEGQSTLGWHSITYEPEILIHGLMFALSVLMIVSYIAGLIFFFHQRHVGRAQ